MTEVNCGIKYFQSSCICVCKLSIHKNIDSNRDKLDVITHLMTSNNSKHETPHSHVYGAEMGAGHSLAKPRCHKCVEEKLLSLVSAVALSCSLKEGQNY